MRAVLTKCRFSFFPPLSCQGVDRHVRDKLLVVLTHDLFAVEDIQPPGEEIERNRKKKALAEAAKRS